MLFRSEVLEKQIYEEAGEKFNINSPKQLSVILAKRRGIFITFYLSNDMLCPDIVCAMDFYTSPVSRHHLLRWVCEVFFKIKLFHNVLF